MLYSSSLLAVAAFATSALAQSSDSSYVNTTGTTLQINLNDVDGGSVTLQSWCLAQRNSCPVLCGGQAFPNECDDATLVYSCVCTNGNQPNISNYDQTVPSFICNEYVRQCVASHPNDLAGITNCRATVCGKQNVSALALGGDGSSSSASGSSAIASATSAASGSASSAAASATSAASSAGASASSAASSAAGSATSAAASATSSASAALLNAAADYSTGILAAAFLAVFGLAL